MVTLSPLPTHLPSFVQMHPVFPVTHNLLQSLQYRQVRFSPTINKHNKVQIKELTRERATNTLIQSSQCDGYIHVTWTLWWEGYINVLAGYFVCLPANRITQKCNKFLQNFQVGQEQEMVDYYRNPVLESQISFTVLPLQNSAFINCQNSDIVNDRMPA